MLFDLSAIALAFLPLLLTFLLSSFLAVLALWLFTWFASVVGLTRVLGRFAAEVVKAYRASIGS